MKRTKIWFVLTAIMLVLVLALCGCGKKKDQTPATTEAKQEKETQTETKKEETKGETKEDQATEPDDDDASNWDDGFDPSYDDCVAITRSLLEELQHVTKVGAGQIQVDDDIEWYDWETGMNYNLITDPDVTSFNDIYMMLYNTFTDGCIENHWKYMFSPDPGTAPFIRLVQEDDVPVGLYLSEARTGYMNYTPTGDIGIAPIDERHFIATIPFSAYGQTMHLNMDIILEGDVWKINGFEVYD